MDNRVGDWMLSSQGNRLWPLDMRAEDVDIEDIAHALSNICRFGGHCREFYSVAQHSVIVAGRVSPENRLLALLHDAPEAYCGDVVRPLKQNLRGFKDIEHGIWCAIAERFGLPEELPEEVLVEDARVLLMEKRDLLVHHEHAWEFPQCAYPDLEVPGLVIVPVSPVEAKRLFLAAFNELSGNDTLQLIADFRGGIPAHCDFCNQPMKPEEAVAEEAGQWACLECWKRFEAEDAALRDRRSEL